MAKTGQGILPKQRKPSLGVTGPQNVSECLCLGEGVMPLQGLISKRGTVYGPATLKAITTAFDEAWAEVEPKFVAGSREAEAYRNLLANAILFVAKATSTDARSLKDEALAVVALGKDGPLTGPGA